MMQISPRTGFLVLIVVVALFKLSQGLSHAVKPVFALAETFLSGVLQYLFAEVAIQLQRLHPVPWLD